MTDLLKTTLTNVFPTKRINLEYSWVQDQIRWVVQVDFIDCCKRAIRSQLSHSLPFWPNRLKHGQFHYLFSRKSTTWRRIVGRRYIWLLWGVEWGWSIEYKRFYNNRHASGYDEITANTMEAEINKVRKGRTIIQSDPADETHRCANRRHLSTSSKKRFVMLHL